MTPTREEVIEAIMPHTGYAGDVMARQSAIDIIAAIEALGLAVLPGWLDIASAPRDVLCLLFEPHDEGGFCFVGCTDVDGEWVNNLDFKVQNPTHWMPLPAAPLAASPMRGEG